VKRAFSAKLIIAKAKKNPGFALATVLIASTVMLTVLVVSVQSTAAIRTALLSQYYSQLARTAAESGINFAEACLNNNPTNSGAPEWSSSKPLQVNTGCDGNVVSACNASSNSAACTVSSNGDVVTNFSVAYPPLDTNTGDAAYGDATSVTATGIVYILRTSQVGTNNPPWRTYKVSLTANLTAISECAPNNTSTAGWTNASYYPGYITPGSPIDLTSSAVNPGPMYYRKDFSVTTPGTYSLTLGSNGENAVSIDGVLEFTNYDNASTVSVSLTAGCHVLVDKLTNGGIYPSVSGMQMTLKNSAGNTLIASDPTWRVITGSTVHFSQLNYSEDTNTWTPARDLGFWSNTSLPWGGAPAGWVAASGDSQAQYITTVNSQSGTNGYTYPASEYSWFRNEAGFTTTSANTSVKITDYCDDSCTVYLDGVIVASGNSGGPVSTTINVANAGTHDFGVRLYNASNGNIGAFLFAAVNSSTGQEYMRSNGTWDSTNFWSSTAPDFYSYDASYVPPTDPAPTCPCSNITNLITNPGFENNTTTNWTANNVTLAVIPSSTWSAGGNYAMSETATGGNASDEFAYIGGDAGALRLGMLTGHTYRVSATLRVPSALSGTLDSANTDRDLGINAYTYDATCGTQSCNYDYALAQAPDVAGVYNLATTFTVYPGDTAAFLRFYNGGAVGAVIDWDDISLVDITNGPAPVSVYYDGNSPNWAWNGTANVATSTGPYFP
jgi:Tfp pilus assembly protein PilX